jgi:hypothetical protein
MNTDSAAAAGLQLAGMVAFACPPPWGPVVGVGALTVSTIMDMFGGSTDALQDAVNTLESFMDQNAIDTSDNDIKAFLAWYAANAANPLDLTNPDNALTIHHELLKPLRAQFDPANPGSGANQLAQLCDNRFIKWNTIVYPWDDDVTPVLVLCVSALSAARQMQIQLNMALAAFGQPAVGTSPTTLANDWTFQRHTSSWINEMALFRQMMCGDGSTPPASNPPDLMAIAQSVGWPQAINQLIQNRVQTRLGYITPIAMNSREHAFGGYYAETPNFWFFDHGPDNNRPYNFGMHENQAIVARQALVKAKTDMITSGYADATQTATQWLSQYGVWQTKMPPPEPVQPPPPSTWGSAATPGSPWFGVEEVRYGVTFVNGNGPSLRSNWEGAWVGTANMTDPTLIDLPTCTGALEYRQIWRQFIYNSQTSADPEGTPTIITQDDGKATKYTDTSPISTDSG